MSTGQKTCNWAEFEKLVRCRGRIDELMKKESHIKFTLIFTSIQGLGTNLFLHVSIITTQCHYDIVEAGSPE